jgi:hypothetical protein
MLADNISIIPVEMRDLPWISALLQKMVDMSFSQYATQEQIEAVMAKKCSPEALTHEMRAGNHFIKLVVDDDIHGIASYMLDEQPAMLHVDKLYALPGELEDGMITRLVNYVKEQARQAGYELLSLFLPPGDEHKLELLTGLGFTVKGFEKIEVCEDFHLDALVLTASLNQAPEP